MGMTIDEINKIASERSIEDIRKVLENKDNRNDQDLMVHISHLVSLFEHDISDINIEIIEGDMRDDSLDNYKRLVINPSILKYFERGDPYRINVCCYLDVDYSNDETYCELEELANKLFTIWSGRSDDPFKITQEELNRILGLRLLKLLYDKNIIILWEPENKILINPFSSESGNINYKNIELMVY